MSFRADTQGVTIVLRGQFNPPIFHPSWLASNNLIKQQEADDAKIEILHASVTSFSCSWLYVNVSPDRFMVSTFQEAFFEPLRDLVLGVLQLLSHTPVQMVGLNRQFHFNLGTKEKWNAVGDRLTPKRDWLSILEKPGMRSLTMEGKRKDAFEGYIRVKAEPSTKYAFGVFIEINDHYQLNPEKSRTSGALEAKNLISEQWKDSFSAGLQIATHIANLESES